mgnify:CR=1 FL=1
MGQRRPLKQLVAEKVKVQATRRLWSFKNRLEAKGLRSRSDRFHGALVEQRLFCTAGESVEKTVEKATMEA